MSPSDERIADLEAENARVQALYEQSQEQIVRLLARVQELEARLAKDSHNSSKPPSSDGLGRKSGKQPGGQVATAARRCGWWRRPLRWSSIVRHAARDARRRWRRTRRCCCANAARSRTCRGCGCA